MTGQTVIVRCPNCGTKNRVPRDRWGERPRCGKCKTPLELSHLFPDTMVEVSDASFTEEVLSFPGPVLVDFTAPW